MRVAIPFWMERVSPVFDVARHLLLIDIENSTEVARCEKRIDETDLVNRADRVSNLGVNVLICGAISRPLRLIMEAKGVDIIGQVRGNTEEIIEAFLKGVLNQHPFLMPGCRTFRQELQPVYFAKGNDVKTMKSPMRIAVTSLGPDLESQVDPRFGRARYLIVIDPESGGFTTLNNSANLNAAQGAGIQTVKDVVNQGIDAVLTGQIGPKAQEALQAARVQVFLGASGTVREALRELMSGQLKSQSKSVGA